MNHALFTLINRYAGRSGLLDNIAVVVAEYLPLLLVAFLGYLFFFKKELREEALQACAATLLALAANFAITLLYQHPRPFMEQPVHLLIRHAPETSFPSDHTTFMLAIAFMLASCSRLRAVGLLFVAISLIGGFARVFCGVHYPLDIAGSFIVALLTTVLTRSLLHNRLTSLIRMVLSNYENIAAKLAVTKQH